MAKLVRGNFNPELIQGALRQGDKNVLQMFGGGATTTGDLAVYDANGNVIDGGVPAGVNARTVSYTAQASDARKLISFNAAAAAALTLPASPPASYWSAWVENTGPGALAIAASSTNTPAGWTRRSACASADALTVFDQSQAAAGTYSATLTPTSATTLFGIMVALKPAASTAPSFVQGNCFGRAANTALGNTVALPFGSANTAGNCLLVHIYMTDFSGPVDTVAVGDAQGNTYAIAAGGYLAGGAGYAWTYVAPNCKAGPNTVTVTAGVGPMGDAIIAVQEYTNAATSSPIDVTATSFTYSSATSATLSVTTTGTHETLVLFGATDPQRLLYGTTIDGSFSDLYLAPGQGLYVATDGTNYFTERGAGGASAGGWSGGSGAGTVTNLSGALTANLPVLGNGGNDVKIGTAIQLVPSSPSNAAQFLNGAATPAFAQVTDANLSTSDITTNNVSTTKHGFAPKVPNDATKYLDGTGAYSVPAGTATGTVTHTGGLTLNLPVLGNGTADVKIGAAIQLVPSSPSNAAQFLNGAATPAFAQVTDANLSVSDITTNNVSITAHGFAPKAPNDSTKFLDGTGAYSVPAGTTALYTVNPAGVSGIYALYYADQGCYVDAGVTLATAGQTIQQWNDQSGNSRNLSQATAGKRPTYQTAGGPPGLTNRTVWAGGQCLQLASAALSTFTIFTLFRGVTPNGILYEQSANASSNPGCFLYTDITSSIEVNRNPANTISARNVGANWGIQREWYLVSHRYGGTHATHSFGSGSWLSLGIVTDGTASADPGSATVTDTLNVGSRNNAASVAFTGDIVALVIFTPFISMTNVQGVVNFLLNKYNVLG